MLTPHSFWAHSLVSGLGFDQKSWKRVNSYTEAYARWTRYHHDIEITGRINGDEARYGAREIVHPPPL